MKFCGQSVQTSSLGSIASSSTIGEKAQNSNKCLLGFADERRSGFEILDQVRVQNITIWMLLGSRPKKRTDRPRFFPSINGQMET